ncbi:MAG: glycosyltransferase family 9 protein [Bacteroidetes bacterium]|nr:glycosyltransferase family 9 protein [Bacteroidota bacterium]
MIITTPVFKALKSANPDIYIGVLASRTNAEIITNNPYVDKIHILPKQWIGIMKVIWNARKENYNAVLNLIFNRTTSGGVLSNLIAPDGIKIGQGDEKYRFYFNILLKLERQSEHMVSTLGSIIEMLFDVRISREHLAYDIFIDAKTEENVGAFLAKFNLRPRQFQGRQGTPYLVFNLSVDDAVRKLTAEQTVSIGKYLGSKEYRTILIHSPNDTAVLDTKEFLKSNADCLSYPEKGTASLLEIAALIKGASAVITPDTSIVHFASAFGTAIIGFYTSLKDNHEWLPLQVNHKIVISDKNQPTSSIPVSKMIEGINEILIKL